jgi:lactate permease
LMFNTKWLPMIAPFIGALGSFFTGSATVSNLMFAPSLFSASLIVGMDGVKILALALVGAGAGNMVALADVLTAKAVVDSKIHLGNLILLILPYCVILLSLVALVGMVR